MDATYHMLVNDIRDKSKKGLITWEPSSFSNSYQATLGNGAIVITHCDDAEIYDNDIPPTLSLSFLNERGDIFHEIKSYTIKDEGYQELDEIFQSAHNTYMKIDETLRSMIQDLHSR